MGGQGDKGTRGQGDKGTRGQGDKGMGGQGDKGMGGQGDKGTRGWGDGGINCKSIELDIIGLKIKNSNEGSTLNYSFQPC